EQPALSETVPCGARTYAALPTMRRLGYAAHAARSTRKTSPVFSERATLSSWPPRPSRPSRPPRDFSELLSRPVSRVRESPAAAETALRREAPGAQRPHQNPLRPRKSRCHSRKFVKNQND